MRIAHEGEIGRFLAMMSDDEIAVVRTICHRIDQGRRTYGPLRLREDRRDYRHEAMEEALDLLFYLTADRVRR